MSLLQDSNIGPCNKLLGHVDASSNAIAIVLSTKKYCYFPYFSTTYVSPGYRYMIHLYCLAVQAGFYSDAVECWPVTQTARVRSPVVA